MMSPVGFDPQQEEFAARIRSFALPFADSYLADAASTEFPWAALRALAAEDLLGLGVSTELGGSGRFGDGSSPVGFGLQQEELARQNFYLAQASYGTLMMAPLLDAHLPSPAREDWVPALVGGERVIAIAVTEPGSGTDAGALTTSARQTAGGWLLTGEKTSVGFTPHAHAVLILARAEGGITAFLVPTDSEGFHQQPFTDLTWRPIGRSHITLEDVFVPDGHVVGPVGGGFRLVLGGFDVGRSVIPLMATAVASRALELGIAWASTRHAFASAIGANQGVSFPLAEGAARLEASRWLSYRALSLGAAGLPHATESAMAKLVGVESALAVIRDVITIHGFRGLSEELPLQVMLRDVAGLEVGEGTPQLQKLVIARALLGRDIA